MTSRPGTAGEDGSTVQRTVVIENERGLHARAAAKFVKVAGGFDAEVSVHKDGIVVSGVSIMGLMVLAAGAGCEIELIANGRQAQQAIDALARLVGNKFEEG